MLNFLYIYLLLGFLVGLFGAGYSYQSDKLNVYRTFRIVFFLTFLWIFFIFFSFGVHVRKIRDDKMVQEENGRKLQEEFDNALSRIKGSVKKK